MIYVIVIHVYFVPLSISCLNVRCGFWNIFEFGLTQIYRFLSDLVQSHSEDCTVDHNILLV